MSDENLDEAIDILDRLQKRVHIEQMVAERDLTLQQIRLAPWWLFARAMLSGAGLIFGFIVGFWLMGLV